MAKDFLKNTGKNIKEGISKQDSNLRIRFNTKTLEYMVYNPVTGKIITYFLPKADLFKNGDLDKYQWILKAYQYFLERIQ